MKYKLLLFFALLSNSFILAQNDSNVSISLLANDKIASINTAQDKILKNITDILEVLKTEFKDIPESQKIALLFTFHKENKPSIEFYSKPKMSSEVENAFIKKLNSISYENTKIIDFPIMFNLNVEDGVMSDVFSEIVPPTQKKINEYQKASLKTKFELNKAWSINEVLPVLSAYQTIVDGKFSGVKNFGKLVKSTNFNDLQNVTKLTSENSDYWRATMEMEKGNLLIPITKIFMLVSQGDFDYAEKFIEMISIFSDSNSISDNYLNELKSRLSLFNKEVEHEINKGIIEHDKGNFEKAIEIYDDILKSYSNSAWTKYEKYYSQNALQLKNGEVDKEERKLWDSSKIGIYKSNPLYNMDVRASNGKEGYLLFRRQEISSLFRDKNELTKDIFKYAEIAMDLGVYDFAAQLFWLSKSYKKSALRNFLYCLEKLNVKNLKENFKGNFEKDFKKLEKEKEKEMKNSTIFQSFKN